MARYRAIYCEVLHRELCAVAAATPHLVDLECVPQGLHNEPVKRMLPELQRRLDGAPDGYDAVLLGYGLCNNGVAGLRSAKHPLVIPRVHDCISCFLGSRRRYQEQFTAHPGTYYLTGDWIERVRKADDAGPGLETAGPGTARETAIYADYARRFGEEEAKYLMETLHGWAKHYERMAFINLGLGDVGRWREFARAEARRRGLAFEELEGDLRMLRALVNGPPWDEEEFLVARPGEALKPSYDERVLASEAAPGAKGA